MAYLLSLGWPWFAGALALGAVTGFLGFSRAKDATFSGGWIVLLGLAALAIGFSASIVEALSGRDALALDIALLAGGAFAAGLPLGGMIKSLVPEQERKRAAAPVAIVLAAAPEPVADEPVVTAEVVAIEPVAADFADPPSMETPLTALERATPEAPAAPRARGKKSAPGVKPATLSAPRDGGADDLARIKGLGPKSLEKLNALGVFHYDQIAAWDLDNARWIGAALGAPGRVERDKWIQQARALASAGVEQ
jgi:predicted flap endonuclease-1-like 5' DNA nuclease